MPRGPITEASANIKLGRNEMAKRTKNAKSKQTARRVPGLVIQVLEQAPPKPEDFERARNHLRQRANALIIELGEQYQTDGGRVDQCAECDRQRG
jgi:hypothetical protein